MKPKTENAKQTRSDLNDRSAPEYRNPIDEMIQRSREHTRRLVAEKKLYDDPDFRAGLGA